MDRLWVLLEAEERNGMVVRGRSVLVRSSTRRNGGE